MLIPGEKIVLDDTPIPRQDRRGRAERQYVWADAFCVRGTRGRHRLVLVVACPFCGGALHVHTAKPDFVSGKRTASCHGGRYFVLVGAVQGEVAA